MAKKWQGTPDDAIKLAALRWFALNIESAAIEMYATDSSRYSEVEIVLKTCLAEVARLRKTLVGSEGDCPPGFVLCRDNVCSPMCDYEDVKSQNS
jgi:hypothetical protein